MKDSIILFLFLIPTFIFAQYPTTGNKSRLGWQTTGDGLIWRGVAGDTVNKPNSRNYPYFQLDTVNSVLYRYIQTRGQWQPVSENIDIDSLIYATRFWVNSNFFPLQGGLLTGTGGAGYVGFPLQSSPPATPATGFSLFAGSTGNNISWMQPDGFFRRLVSPVTGVARQYQFMARSYTLGDSADIANNVTSIAANYAAVSNGTNLVARNIFDNNTYAGVISRPWKFGEYTTAGLPTGVTGYTVYNTTTNGPAWYQGSRWAYGLESTFNRGTATRLLFSDANGQATDNGGLTFIASTGLIITTPISFSSSSAMVRIGMNSNNPTVMLEAASGERASVDNNAGTVRFVRNAATVPFQFSMSTGDLTAIGNAIFQGTGTTIFNQGGGNFGIGTALPNGLQINTLVNPTARATPNIRLGVAASSNPQINFEAGSSDQWAIDNLSGVFRFIRNGSSVPVQFSSTGQVGLGGAASYVLHATSTNAFGLPRGTVAQRPTIVASTTPLRYNTDSTALEYGESVGTWRLLATRAYARSLVSALPTTNIYTANGTATGNRVYSGANYTLDFNGVSKFGINSNRFNFSNNSFYSKNVDTTGTAYWGSEPYYGTSYPGQNGFWFRDSVPNTSEGNLYIFNGKYGTTGRKINHALGASFYGGDSFDSYNIAKTGSTTGSATYNYTGVTVNQYRGLGYSSASNTMQGTIKGIFGRADTTYHTEVLAWNVGDTINSGSNLNYIFNENRVYGAMPGWFSTAGFSTDPMGQSSAYFPAGYTTGLSIGKNVNNVKFSALYMPFFAGNKDENSIYDFVIIGEIAKFDTVKVQLLGYGTGAKEATDLSKTQSNYIAGFATDGTILEIERKRDTTVYIDDADYDFSAALTTAQIARRYNRVIFWMTTTAAAGSDSDITLHTPDANLMQVEYLIHSVDEAGGFSNKIVFGTNNAVDSTNGLVTNYYPSAGDGIHIRAGLRSGVYKYRYSN